MKRKRKDGKPEGADLLAAPGMEGLAAFTKEILKVPKAEVERRAAEEAARRSQSDPRTRL